MGELSNKLATKIFDALYDEEDLKELEQKKVISQAIGFKLSTIAIIECEIEEQLQQDKAELVDRLKDLTDDMLSGSGALPLSIVRAMEILEKHK